VSITTYCHLPPLSVTQNESLLEILPGISQLGGNREGPDAVLVDLRSIAKAAGHMDENATLQKLLHHG
jgi:hypothetical protein